MNRTGIVFIKELVDNLRDRRTVATALFFGPVFGPLMFMFLINTTVKLAKEEADQPLELAVIGGEHAPNLLQYLKANNVRVLPGPADAKQSVRDKEHTVVLVIPAQYAEQFRDGEPAVLQLVTDSAEAKDEKYARHAEKLLEGYARMLTAQRLVVRGVAPQVMAPVVVEDVDVASQRAKAALLLAMIPYFVIAGGLMGGFYLAADTTAGERERGSLEPLLSTAASRRELVIGKLGATTVYSGASLFLTLTAYSVVIQFLPLEELGMRAGLDLPTFLRIISVALPFVLLGAGLMITIASFTKSYKEAQTYLSFVTLIPIIPLFMTMYGTPKTMLWMMAIPALSQQLLVTQMLKGDVIAPLFIATSIGSTLLVGVLLSALAVHLYSRERILG